MVVTVEELKRLEETDIRDLRREDLDNAGDIVIDRSKPANHKVLERRLAEVDGKTEKRNQYLRTLMKCRKNTPLTDEVLHTLIKKIEVFKGKRVLIHFAYSSKEIRELEGGGRK